MICGCAGCSWADRAGLPAVGTPSAIPSVWVGVYLEVGLGLFALVKCYTCWQGASGVRLLTFGQQLV